MKVYIRAAVLALVAVLVTAATAFAAKTFVVAPFVVNGPSSYGYLEQSIPQMFASRLFWQGNFEPVQSSAGVGKIAPGDAAAAEKALTASKADYIIWGSVTVVGNNCSVDVRVRDRAGTAWPLSRESNINRLIPDLRQVSDAISAQVFRRTQATDSSAHRQGQGEPANQMNPALVRNDTSGGGVYINPQFRYSGRTDDESRLRSQAIPFASVGMEVCDATGDGQKEVFLLGERGIYAYHFDSENQLKPLGVLELPATQEAMSIRSFDSDMSGRSKLVVNSKDGREELLAQVFSFDGKNFKEEARGAGVYLNVVTLPPLFRPQLIAQRTNPPHLFMPGVSEASISGKKIIFGSKLSLPKDFNVFNFAYIPAGANSEDGMKLVMLDPDERLRLYSEKGSRLAGTEERYSGAVQGIYVDLSLPGFGKETDRLGQTYFIPMRMLATDLDKDGNYEIIVNKPISTAGLIFGNYRSFPQSEIHSLQWDGMGLALVWKTRRIKGSVVDYTITDVNNDGTLDLVVNVNTHPGALGASARKTMVVAYPLDLSKADPNTRPSSTE